MSEWTIKTHHLRATFLIIAIVRWVGHRPYSETRRRVKTMKL